MLRISRNIHSDLHLLDLVNLPHRRNSIEEIERFS